MYAFGGAENGGPPASAGFVEGNSRQIKLAWGFLAKSVDIRFDHAGRMEGLIAQKN